MENSSHAPADFKEVIDLAIQKAWDLEDGQQQPAQMVSAVKLLVSSILHTGDQSAKQLQTEENATDYILSYWWPEKAKAFLVLWRDVIFERIKAEQLLKDGKIGQGMLEQLEVESKKVLLAAAVTFKASPEVELETINQWKGGINRQMGRWRLQHSPWPVYRKQIEEINRQYDDLLKRHEQLTDITLLVNQITDLIEQNINSSKKELNDLETDAQKHIAFIEDSLANPEELKPGRIATRLEESESSLVNPATANIFTEHIEDKISKLPERLPMPMATKDGMLQFREINFRRSIRLWLESEILPGIYELWELADKARNGQRMALVNIKNRALLLSAEIRDGKKIQVATAEICQPLIGFGKNITAIETEYNGIAALVEDRLQTHFHLSALFDTEKEFLAIPQQFQSAFNQIRLNQGEWLGQLGQWWDKQLGALRKIRKEVAHEESLSRSEKIVRYLRQRMPDANNTYYTGIFLTKGFIGNSFWVGREQELKRIATLIGEWQLGFRGAVLISGARFSGKSLFGETIAHRFFPNKTIRLAPNITLHLDGRSYQVDYQLDKALEFIVKYSLNSRPLVWIDDLELWQDTQTPLGQNVRHLRRFVDIYSGKLFFLVAMSHWMKIQLDRYYDLDKAFQANIRMRDMTEDEIRQAILIRHGATHRMLSNPGGEEASPQQFRKMTAQIHRVSQGNIGEALNYWTYFTSKLDEERVVHEFKSLPVLPDMPFTDTLLLLNTLMMAKRSNEYRLRKLFGGAFKEKYNVLLQRLIGVGLVERHLDNWLEVNEVAANDVARMLSRKQFLEFQK